MSSKNDSILKKMCNSNGVSGYESDIINFLYDRLKAEASLDDIYIDNVGNLICYRKGTKSKKTIMINAHIDEVGFQIIGEINPGEYKIKSLGNIKTWNAIQQRVSSKHFHGIIYSKNYENIKPYNYDNLFLKIMSGIANIGDVYWCNRIHELRSTINILNISAEEVVQLSQKVKRDTSVDNTAVCKVCEIKYICGGGCRMKYDGIKELDNHVGEWIYACEGKDSIYEKMILSNEYFFEE